jgi:hypothetical protein
MREGASRPVRASLAAAAVAALLGSACTLFTIGDSIRLIGTQSTASGDMQVSLRIVDAGQLPVAGVEVTVTLGDYVFEATTGTEGLVTVPVYYNPGWGIEPKVRLDFSGIPLAAADVVGKLSLQDASGKPISGFVVQSDLGSLRSSGSGLLQEYVPSIPFKGWS